MEEGYSLYLYLIDREFSHWKVSSLVTEKRGSLQAPLPLAPEFQRNLRLLGRRPTLQQINENLIKKYGTHFLVSATLGGEKDLILTLLTLTPNPHPSPLTPNPNPNPNPVHNRYPGFAPRGRVPHHLPGQAEAEQEVWLWEQLCAFSGAAAPAGCLLLH